MTVLYMVRGARHRDVEGMSADVRDLVVALAAARGPDAAQLLAKVVEVCGMGSIEAETWGGTAHGSVHLEFAAAGAVDVTIQLVAHALATEPLESHTLGPGSLIWEGMLVLATLAAKRECAAWFAGTGAIVGIVSAIERAATLRSPPQFDDGIEQPGVESLGASALANLAYPPDSEEGSTAVAKEILSVGAVVPLLRIMPGNTEPGGSPHAQQWAAAALCNLSMHGHRARQMMIEAGTFPALSAAITWLSCGQAEGVRQGARQVEARAVTTQLLLGCLTNVTAFHEEPTQLLYAGGDDDEAESPVVLAVESALAVLETAPAQKASVMTAHGDGATDNASASEDPLHAAATALLLQMADTCGDALTGGGPKESDTYPGKDTKGSRLLSQLPHRLLEIAVRAGETQATGGTIWNATANCAEILCTELDVSAATLVLADKRTDAATDENNKSSVIAEKEEEEARAAARIQASQRGRSTRRRLAAEEKEAKAATRIQARQRGRSTRRHHAANREAKRMVLETDDCETGFSEADLLKIELMLEERHAAEDRRLQQLMTEFKRHDSGSGKETLGQVGLSLPLSAVTVFADECDENGDGLIDFGEFARAVSMLDQLEREMDRKVLALAQEKAFELQENMARAESYQEGRELQVQYKTEMAQASATLNADRHAQRRKLEARLQARKSRHRQYILGTETDTTPTSSTIAPAMLSKHERQVRNYLQEHHRDDLLPVYEHTLRPLPCNDDHDQELGMNRQGAGPDEPPPPPPPPPVTDTPPVAAKTDAHDEQENAPPPDADSAGSKPEGQSRPRGRPRPSIHGRTRAAPNGWTAAGHRTGTAAKVSVKLGGDGQPPPPANALSLETYLGLAAARRNLSNSVNTRKVKVTPKMREQWAKQGKLLEF